jgi:hypothetical protein
MPSVPGNMEDTCVVLKTTESVFTAACRDGQGNLGNTGEMCLFFKKMKREKPNV